MEESVKSFTFATRFENKIAMGVTRLKRKGRRNVSKAKNKVISIQRLSAKPVIKNVDVEQIKAEFSKAAAPVAKKATKKAAEKEETVE
jgi:hypothetical protein